MVNLLKNGIFCALSACERIEVTLKAERDFIYRPVNAD